MRPVRRAPAVVATLGPAAVTLAGDGRSRAHHEMEAFATRAEGVQLQPNHAGRVRLQPNRDRDQIVFRLDSLERIAGHPVRVVGSPKG